jgi:hypothetical protein
MSPGPLLPGVVPLPTVRRSALPAHRPKTQAARLGEPLAFRESEEAISSVVKNHRDAARFEGGNLRHHGRL